MCPDLSEWHNGCVVSYAGAGGYHRHAEASRNAVHSQESLCSSWGCKEESLLMLGHLSGSSGSLAVLKYLWAKQENAAVLLCSCNVLGKGSTSTNIKYVASPKPQAADLKEISDGEQQGKCEFI